MKGTASPSHARSSTEPSVSSGSSKGVSNVCTVRPLVRVRASVRVRP